MRQDMVEGGNYGGTATCIRSYAASYCKLLSHYASHDKFFGNDQALMNAITLHDPAATIHLATYKARRCTNTWFFFAQFFALDKDRWSRCQPEDYERGMITTTWQDRCGEKERSPRIRRITGIMRTP